MIEYVDLETEKKKRKPKNYIVLEAVMPLILINIIIFIIQMTVPGFTDMFILKSSDIFNRPWILFTAIFLHANFNHLLFNMYALFLFGTLLEKQISSKRFLTIYITIGIMVSILSSFFYDNLLGASGAIMGIIGVLIVLMPNLRLLLFFIIPIRLWQAGVIWFLLDFFGILFPSNTANWGHIFGLLLGLIYGLYFRHNRKKFYKDFEKKIIIDMDDADEYNRKLR